MDVNRKIEQALSGVGEGNIWLLVCPLEELPKEYIVYLPEREEPEEFGDNEALAWVYHIQVHWYKKESQSKPADYRSVKEQVKDALRAAGFIMSEIKVLFEKDTGYTHLVFSCSMKEE